MAKRMTKAMKVEAAAKAAAEAPEATTATEATTTAETTTVEAAAAAKPAKAAKVKPIEVIGDMEDLIKAFGTVEAVIEACANVAQQGFVELYEFGDEPGAKGSKMRWGKVVVVSHDIKIADGSRKVWIMMSTPAIITAYRASLRGQKFFQQALPEALESFKRLDESRAAWLANKNFKEEVKAGQAERVAKFATMNLQDPEADDSPWRALNTLRLEELPDVLANRIVPVGAGEKPALLQEFLGAAAGTLDAFVADLKEELTVKGELKTMADYRAVYETVQQAWWKDKKVVPYVKGIRLVTRQFSSQNYGVVLFEDDVRSFIEEMDRQFDAWAMVKKAEFEREGKQFTPPTKPGVEVKDPVYGFLAFLLFSAKREAEVLARRRAERADRLKAVREAKEAARAAENAKAVAGFKVGLGAIMAQKFGMRVESLADLADATTKQSRKPKGDRRHNRDDN